jgi:hypothetical protein
LKEFLSSVSECPVGAMTQKHFTSALIEAMVREVGLALALWLQCEGKAEKFKDKIAWVVLGVGLTEKSPLCDKA